MKNAKNSTLGKVPFILIFIFLLLFVFTLPAMSDTISIVADEWAPYNGNPNSTEKGYGIDIAIVVFEAAGHKVSYKIIPWSRAIKETREGQYNAIIGAFKEDAPDFIFPEEEFGISVNSFFVKKGNPWKYKGIESLNKISIGLIKDYSYGEEFDKFFTANNSFVQYVHGKDPLISNIKKLIAGRFDVLIADSNVLLQKAMKMGVSDQIAKAGNSVAGQNIYIAFSPKIAKSKEYADIFTKGIRKLKASGELDKILEKYGLDYWK